jgi:DNA polymerase-3 subunit delta'
VPLLPLYGHDALRRRLRETVARGTLPASLLLHGPRGTGKQRLALWLGQLLLCDGSGEHPCGTCTQCKYVLQLVHPDLRWFFPRLKADGSDDPSPQEVLDEYAEAAAERAANGGLYPPPSGLEAIFVASVRGLVQHAAYTPTVAQRKVIIVGDAERMVAQAGAEAAANAFLKLLEEPPADTTVIITTSEPGALLPTIRSRVVAMRVPPLPERDVRAWLANAQVRAALDSAGAPKGDDARAELAAGAPGTLLASSSREEAVTAARQLLAAAVGDRATQARTILSLGGSKARGFFSDMLDAMTSLLHQRAREAVLHNDAHAAVAASRAIDAVQEARESAANNINPHLLGAALVRRLERTLG